MQGFKNLKFKNYSKYGTVYLADLSNLMFIVQLESPFLKEDNPSRVFVYSEETRKVQSAKARKFYNKLKSSLARGDFCSIDKELE